MMLPVLLFFLPAAVLLTLLLPGRLKIAVPAVGGAGLLCLCGGYALLVTGLLSVFTGWLTVRLMPGEDSSAGKRRRNLCFAGIAVQLLLLVTGKFLFTPVQMLPLVLLAMQNIDCMLARACGEMPVTGLFPYCCYAFEYPRLFAGPPLSYADAKAVQQERDISLQSFGAGASLCISGLFQAAVFGIPLLTLYRGLTAEGVLTSALDAFAAAAALFLGLYYGLKGAAAFGRGTARLTGLRYPAMFDCPCAAVSLREFALRTFPPLSQWCGRNLLAGLQPGDTASYFARVLLFCGTAGLFLGESAGGLLWGLFAALLLTHQQHKKQHQPEKAVLLRRILTFFAVLLPLPLLRCGSLTGLLSFYGALLGRNGAALSASVRALLGGKAVLMLAAAAGLLPLRRKYAKHAQKHASLRLAACLAVPLLQLLALLLSYAVLYSLSVRS